MLVAAVLVAAVLLHAVVAQLYGDMNSNNACTQEHECLLNQCRSKQASDTMSMHKR
jgi:hypothetical protein